MAGALVGGLGLGCSSDDPAKPQETGTGQVDGGQGGTSSATAGRSGVGASGGTVSGGTASGGTALGGTGTAQGGNTPTGTGGAQPGAGSGGATGGWPPGTAGATATGGAQVGTAGATATGGTEAGTAGATATGGAQAGTAGETGTGGAQAGAAGAAATGGETGAGAGQWVTIHNDFYWSDQNGNRIQTRSGTLTKFGDTYYWYGGNNFFRDQTCYTSQDLINWEYQGVVLHVDVEANRIDVLYNEATEQYVMVMKYDGNGAHVGFATSPAPEGPFTFEGQTLLDDALMGDSSVFQDADGKAYLNAVSWKTGTNAQHGIWLLSSDYLSVERRVFLWDLGAREAPMVFNRNGIYYYATSATDWTVSTSTMYYSATDLEGPWTDLTPMKMGDSENSWDSQCDLVLPIEGSEETLYLYVGDRWEKPDPRREGDYVWLPITFEGDAPVVDYYQDWDLNVAAGTWRPFDYSKNLALGKVATASSANGGNAAENAIDEKTYLDFIDTRWESDASDPQWIMVDLGSVMDVNRVILKWHENAGRAFQVQVSTDASTWQDVFSTDIGGSRSVTDVTFDRVAAQYVRMNGTQRTGRNGYSLFDFAVLNDDDAASSTEP